MVTGLFRLVLFVFIAYVVFLAVRIYLGLKRAGIRARAPRQVGGVMVQDEICETYLPREEALVEHRDGVEHFFCSEECRRKFRQG
jgi:YHS domain-containing protein